IRPNLPVPANCSKLIWCSWARRNTAGEYLFFILEDSGDVLDCSFSSCSVSASTSDTCSLSSVSIYQINVSTSTVSPSLTTISVIVPVKEDGISAFTLSVVTSAIGSYLLTWSPSEISQVLIVPSTTLSPSLGMVISSLAII